MFNFFYSNRKPDVFWYTDIHSHVCPGVDDGSRNCEQSVTLVEGMWNLGFRRMIVTPHVTDEVFPNTPDILSESYLRLVDAVNTAGLQMNFNYSAEYRVDGLLAELLDKSLVRPLPGNKHILIEYGWSQPPYEAETLVFELRDKFGLIPILAHPERYPYFQHHPEEYKRLHDCGMLFQINLLSLAGHYNKPCKQTAEMLLSNDLVEFVGSDIHRQSHLDSLRRYFCSRDYKKLETKRHLILNDTAFQE